MTKEKKGTSAKDIKDITEFVRNDTNEHVSRREVNDAISWLRFSKILGGCDLYNQGNVADLLSQRRFYFMDCGYLAEITRGGKGRQIRSIPIYTVGCRFPYED